MAEVGLDQIVKGAPPPNVSLPSVAAAASASQSSTSSPINNSSSSNTASISTTNSSTNYSDPTSLLPSSPPQIYLNLLILEASLRSQYLTLRARRRQNTFVLIVLALWITYFVYCQFLRPRADGAGVGGSEYWLVDVIEKVALLSGVVMSLLFKLTGQWERGVRWPARWLRTTNRGLKGMNCKIVVLKDRWWREAMSHLSFLFPISTLVDTPGSNYQYIEYDQSDRNSRPPQSSKSRKDRSEVAEEDIALGGDFIKILLLPKHFTPEFRDNWDTYRAEYWDQENQRRARLRQKFREREKALAKQQSPWFWWIPGRRIVLKAGPAARIKADADKAFVVPTVNVTHGGSQRQRRAASVLKDDRGSHSRSSSRSSVGPSAADADERERRWSTSTSSSLGGERRRRKAAGAAAAAAAAAAATGATAGTGTGIGTSTAAGDASERRSNPASRIKTPASGSRPSTPNATHALRPQGSNLSILSSGSEGDTPPRPKVENVAIKREPMD